MSSSLREKDTVSGSPDTVLSPQNRHTVKFWVWTWFPVLLGITVIAVESTEFMGADHTSIWLRRIYEALFGHVSWQRWEVIHHYIRKSGHFLGYGLIGLAWLRAWWFTLSRSRFFKDVLLAMLCTAAMASSDEFHQSYLPNRGSSIRDVLLDCTGAFTLQLLVYLYMRLINPRQLARAA